MQHEGEGFTREMVIRGTKERLVPVLMTALAAGIGLIPLVLAADQPGKEILHPVAVVIVGGLVTSTLLGLGVTPTVFYTFGRKAAQTPSSAKPPPPTEPSPPRCRFGHRGGQHPPNQKPKTKTT